MKSLRLTIKQRESIKKFWKEGEFKLYNIRLANKTKVLKEWERLGIIKKISTIDYKIDREQFVKLDGNRGQVKLQI